MGVARSVCNLMVATHQMARAQGHGYWPNPMELEKQFNELKHKPEFGMEYATEVSKFVPREPAASGSAYENWRNPELVRKNRPGTGSGRLRRYAIKYDGQAHQTALSGVGETQARAARGDPLRGAQPERPLVRQRQLLEAPVGAEEKTHLCGAVDVGIAPLAVDSELVHYDNPKALYSYLRKLRRWQRALERRTVGSRGWREAQQRINAIHRRIIGLREDAHHQVSRLLVGKYAVLAIESLNVAGMDPGQRRRPFGELLQQIRYKAGWYGTVVVEADRFYPSSKLCSDCGAHNAALGRELYWTCSQCGVRHDRNENAALNLLGVALEAARELPKLALGPVGPDVTLLDGKALAGDKHVAGETGPVEGRTAPLTQVSPAVDGGTASQTGSRKKAVTNTQLRRAI